VVSRILYFAAGVRFDARTLDSFYQIIDPVLMKTRLLESLFYLHTQPPGFNLILGVVVKLFPGSYTPVFHAMYLLCGLSLCFTLYRLMRILGVRPAVATTLTSVFLASPGVVLFENFLMYAYPLMALLCASAVAFHRLLTRPAWASATLFFASLTVLAYLRALFHLAWFVLLAVFAGWILKGRRRMIAAAAVVPFLLALGLFVKNAVVFGSFTSSTWMGFNADTITLHNLTPEEHERLIASGLLSEVGRISGGEALSEFKGFITLPPPTGIPILDQIYDSTGRRNYNHPGYLLLHPYYLHDAKAIILHYPRAYLRSLEAAWFAYFLPSGDFPFFDLNHPRIAGFDRFFNVVFFGQWKYAPNRKDLRHLAAEGSTAQLPLYTGTYLMIGLPVLFCWGLWRLWVEVHKSGWRTPSTAVLGFVLFHIAYITAIVNFLSSFENNRYRLPLDPFFVALLGMAIEAVLTKRTTQRSPAQD
jgi:hypothetical protein